MVIEANKWMTVFVMAFSFFAGLVIAVVFFIDPFLYYRNISNDKKLMEPRYTSIGIIKNYKHDMTILGMDSNNSMDMLYIRNYHERKPIQLGIEDSNLNEVLMLYTMAQENSNTDLYFINVKTEEFLENIELDLSSPKFPKYLYNKSGLDDIKYLLNYEICFRYILLNTIIDTAFKLNKSLPAAMRDGTEIDKVVQWKLNSRPVNNLAKGTYKDFHIEGLTTIDTGENINNGSLNNLNMQIEERINSYLEIIFNQLKPSQTLIFGFMPYAVEYWAHISEIDFDTIMYAKEYFIKECSKKGNVKLVDLQGISEISDPINYIIGDDMDEDLMRLYTDAVFDETFYESSKLFDRNRKRLEKQISIHLEKE